MWHKISHIFNNDPRRLGNSLILSGIAAWAILLLVIFLITFVVPKLDNERITAIGTMMGALGTVGVLLFISYQAFLLKRSIDRQTESIKLETKTFSLEQRPYLYVFFEPQFGYDDSAIYCGGPIVYMNKGRIPASNVTSMPEAYSNKRRIPIMEWHKKAFGSFSEVQNVFPEQRQTIFFRGGTGDQATFFYIAILVTYTGVVKGKTYWYKFSEVYNIAGDGKKVSAVCIETETDWDKDLKKPIPPPPEEPDWSKYKDYLGQKMEKN